MSASVGLGLHAKTAAVLLESYAGKGHKRKLEDLLTDDVRAYQRDLCTELLTRFDALADAGERQCTLSLCAERTMHSDAGTVVMHENGNAASLLWKGNVTTDTTELLALDLAEWALENGIMCTLGGRNYTEDADREAFDEHVLKFTWA